MICALRHVTDTTSLALAADIVIPATRAANMIARIKHLNLCLAVAEMLLPELSRMVLPIQLHLNEISYVVVGFSLDLCETA
jgi:hypothetical protein